MLFQVPNNENLSRKEREKLYKRNEILSASVPLFAEKGYENTTIDDIAEKAEFGKGTIYNYFNGKEEIFQAIIEEIFNGYFDAVVEIDKNCEKFFDFIQALTRTLFDFCFTNKHAFIIITRLRTGLSPESSKPSDKIIEFQKSIDKIFGDRIKEAVKKEEINKIEPSTLMALYRSMIFPYIYNQMFCNKKENVDLLEESDLLVNILFNGIKK